MRTILAFLIILSPFFSKGQETLDKLLDLYNTKSIPYISIEELIKIQDQVILLDAREKEEYEVSHLKKAIHVGYDTFNPKEIVKQQIPKDSLIVVYCSLGIRSEDISEKLKNIGYKNVYNLYGGIFEWKNNDLPLVNLSNKTTNDVHVFSSEWEKWLSKGKKVYPNQN